jgi:hypothetical protein
MNFFPRSIFAGRHGADFCGCDDGAMGESVKSVVSRRHNPAETKKAPPVRAGLVVFAERRGVRT